MDRKRLNTVLTAGALALCAASSARAHHSHAMFDDSREITVAGTVAGVSYANPHVHILVETASTGGAERWSVEMSHIGNMVERGVQRDTIEVGNDIVISMNPLRNGQRGGNYTRIVSINGVENAAEGSAWTPASGE